MILYANGCSWTAGGGLEPHFIYPHNGVPDNDKRLSLLWPHHLGQRMGASKVYNLANGCGSNQRIVRKTYNWLLSRTKKELEQTVAVIQMTEWSRLEMYDPKVPANRWDDDPSDWVNCKVDVICNDIEHMNRHRTSERREEILKEAQHRIMLTHNVEDFYRTISYLYALKGMFEAFNVKDFYVWHQSHLWWEWPEQHVNALFKNFKVIDQPRSKDFPLWEYETVSDTDLHPSVEGNKQLANHIYIGMKNQGFGG